jgi:hypothetical protein
MQHSPPSSKLPLEAITVCRELHEMGFHGRAAAHKHKISMHNAKLSGVKLTAIVLWSDESLFTIWQSDERILVWWMP